MARVTIASLEAELEQLRERLRQAEERVVVLTGEAIRCREALKTVQLVAGQGLLSQGLELMPGPAEREERRAEWMPDDRFPYARPGAIGSRRPGGGGCRCP